ncbi:MAG TPA: copper amine oxidase N-terminal domain-containing protein [Abditibacterium sp.]|jgi:hypothetical protein
MSPLLSPRLRFFGPSLLAGASFLAFSAPVGAQTAPLTVTVDGRPVDFGGASPTQVGGRTLVPLRAIFEALGAQVEFSAGTIRARRGETQLQLALGSTQASVNGSPRVLEVPAQSVFGRTLVPLRFVGEAFGAGVSFNAATGTIAISSPGGAGIGIPATGADNVPYTVPGSGQSVTGTLIKIDVTAPATVTLSVGGALKTYALSENPLALRQISLASSATATPVRQPARQIALTSLAAGDPLRLSLGADNRVSQITSTATVVVARVQFAGNNQIVLDDERDTTLSIGPAIRFIDANGRVSTNPSALTPGQNIALFLSRETRAIYQVSAYAPDFTASTSPTNAGGAAAGAGTPDPLPNGGLPTAGGPQIQLVSHNASAPLRAGSRLEVSVRATPGLRATFSLGTKVQNVALAEDPAQRGVYSGSYTVRAGDDVLNSRVLARVVGADGTEDFAQSTQTATIDTVAPRLVGTFPSTGAQITVAQPNIAIFADDLGGSGLGEARVDLISNGVTTRIPATVAPPTSINAVAPAPLSGPVSVRAVITDKAGNPLNVNFNFTVGAGTGDISSFSHGANRAAQPGDNVPLVMDAQPAGRATFDVIAGRNQTISRDVPLVEVEPGRYRATYRIPAGATGNLRFVGKFTTADGTASQLETTTRVQLTATPARLTIQTPTEGDRVTSPLTISGQAAPGATIDVALSAQGTQLFILEYKQDLGVQQVRADANGAWTVRVDLPTPRNVSGLQYIISATQTDAAGKVSEPVVVTVAR